MLRAVAWPYGLVTVLLVVVWFLVGVLPVTQVLELATFWWTLPALVLAPLAALLRDRRATVLLLIPALVWVWSYAGAFLPGGSDPAGAEDTLRVVTFNSDVAAPDESHVNELVADLDPDLLVVQEVFPAREERLRETLEDPLPHVHVDQSERIGGVGVFSRYPIVEVVPVREASERSRTTSIVVIDVDGQLVQVVPVHLISPCPSCGASAVERLELEDDVRQAEIDAVLERLDPDLPAIVAGDLNSNDRSVAYRSLVEAGFDDPQRSVGEGMGFTWPGSGRYPPVLRIDWIFTRGLTPIDAFVGPPQRSDHRPVVVDLAVPNAG